MEFILCWKYHINNESNHILTSIPYELILQISRWIIRPFGSLEPTLVDIEKTHICFMNPHFKVIDVEKNIHRGPHPF